MQRDQIFVSYSHRDKRWLEELVVTLAPLTRKRKIIVWDDTKIGIGAKWRSEITKALRRAKVAVLLVSRYFLHSEFIAKNELPPLLDAAEKDGLVIAWIAVGFSSYEETNIADYQAANDPARPLNSLSESETDFTLVKIAKALDRILDGNETDSNEMATERPDTYAEDSSDDVAANADRQGARERIYEALADGKWAWRTVDALAAKAALTAEQTLDLLRRDPEVVLGRGKSGKQIARSKSRHP